MQTGIKNRYGYNVEQLSTGQTDTILNITSAAGVYGQNTISIPVQFPLTYEINRIRLIISYFENDTEILGEPITFAKWEQFVAALIINAELVDSGNNAKKTLFTGMEFHIVGGADNYIIFEEPLIIKVNNSSYTRVRFSINPANSVFVTLTGMAVPPPFPSIIEAKGKLILEGFSYGSIPDMIINEENNVKAAEYGADVQNLIEIVI